MKILIVKISALGDVIQCFLALDFLHRYFPNAEIDWVVEKSFAGLLQAHPFIHQVYQVEIKKWKHSPFQFQSWKEAYQTFKHLRQTSYDLVFDFQGNLKSGLLIGSTKSLKKVGFSRSSAPEWPNHFFISKKVDVNLSKPIVLQYLKIATASFYHHMPEGSPIVQLRISKSEKVWIQNQLVEGPRMMVCIGSNWENKRLSDKTWEVFLKKIKEKISPTFYFVWGSKKEKEEVEKLQRHFPEMSYVLPKMSLPVWQQMMSHMNMVISVDSSALHLAATTKTRTYSFFGPSSAEVYKPIGQQHGCFQGSCPYGQFFIKRCSKLRSCTTGACLKEIKPSVLFEHFCNWYYQ